MASGLADAALKSEFLLFAKVVENAETADRASKPGSATGSESIAEALFSYFLKDLVSIVDVPGKTLQAAILDRYNALNTANNREALFLYQLYLYVALHHFSAWYVVTKRSGPEEILETAIRTEVAAELGARSYQGGITIAPEFFAIEEFRQAFRVDGTLQDMVGPGRLGRLIQKSFLAPYDYLIRGGRRSRAIDGLTARAVKKEFVQSFRQTMSRMISSDVKKLLAKLHTPPSSAGVTLADEYGEFRQFAVGDGTSTKAMLGQNDFGLIFFDYVLNDLSNLRTVSPALLVG